MSIMVGVGRGAQAGVLIKNAEALERFEKVDTLVVDKTGTLTEGKPTRRGAQPAPGFSEDDAAAARGQPRARAASIRSRRRSCAPRRIAGLALAKVDGLRGASGKGVSGTIDGRKSRSAIAP